MLMKKLKEKKVLQSNGLAEIFELQSLTKYSYAIQKSYYLKEKYSMVYLKKFIDRKQNVVEDVIDYMVRKITKKSMVSVL